MRITNNMIMSNTKTNINSTKQLVDKYNTQMTTQKKISKASDDPVIAIRSLRLSTNLTHIDQFVDNNIPDADSWLDVTETALKNMKTLLTDIRTQCVNGSTDTLTADDRNTILKQLTAMKSQVYTEGNSDYAGRTVFTGYRTSSKLTFQTDSQKTTYEITQSLGADSLEEKRYYTNGVTVPGTIGTATPDCDTDVKEYSYQRIRLGYGNTTSDVTLSIDGTDTAFTNYKYSSDFDPSKLGDDDIAYIQETGEFVFGKNVSTSIKDNNSKIEINYVKTGFDADDARPEYYYNCRDISDAVTLDADNNIKRDASGNIIYDNPDKIVTYKNYDDNGERIGQPISYTVATGTELTVNTQAKDVLDTGIKRDVDELITVVQNAINAHDKVSQIEGMMKQEQYADKDSQAKLKTYLDAAKQEADYADNNMQKTYGQYITKFDNHMNKVNLALTNSGSTQSRLTLIKNRVEEQKTTVEELKSTNEDRDLSDIIIDFYAMYNAYQSSLTAAGLNYSVKTDYSDSVAEGNVIGQDVEAGKTVAPGTTVTITVSLGSNTKYYSFSYTLNYTLGHETQDNTETGEAGKKVTGFSAVLKDGSGNTIEGASWNSNMTSNDSYNMTADNIKNTASGNLVVTWSYSDGSTEDQTIGVSFNAK